MKISLKGRPAKLTKTGKRKTAEAMYSKGKNFIVASILLQREGGYEFVVLHLLCQGIEIVLKSFLLFKDYDRYWPRLKCPFGHNLEKLAFECMNVYGLKSSDPRLSEELHRLNRFYGNHWLRYGSFIDVLIDPNTIPSHRVFRRIAATIRLAERSLTSGQLGGA